jgi:hypothetical protein
MLAERLELLEGKDEEVTAMQGRGVAGCDGMISPKADRRPREKRLQWAEETTIDSRLRGAQRAW